MEINEATASCVNASVGILFWRERDRENKMIMNVFSSVFTSSQYSYILWSFCEEGHTRTGGSAMGMYIVGNFFLR